MAPHGMAPMPLASARGAGQIELSGGYGGTSNRNLEKTELSVGGQIDDWFGIGLHGQHIRVQDSRGQNAQGQVSSRTVHMFQPYIRPTIFAGPMTLSMPFSGFAFGGGGGGVAAGLWGIALGVGGKSWNVFSGIQWQGSEFVSSSSYSSSARELCFGGRFALTSGYFRLSIDPQLVFSKHNLSLNDSSGNESGSTDAYVSNRTFTMGLLQLSVALGDWQAKSKAQDQTVTQPVQATKVRPSACREFCEMQQKIPCGRSADRCESACEQREVREVCRDASEQLLRCEARDLSCDGVSLRVPECEIERRMLKLCEGAGQAEREDAR
jgi:hypothetical protein